MIIFKVSRQQAVLQIMEKMNLKKLPPKANRLGRVPPIIPRSRGKAFEDIKDRVLSKKIT